MESIKGFSDFKLSKETYDAVVEMGFVKPTKIQLKAIPFCLKNKDVVAQAKTGSGKTLVFLLSIIENLHKINCNGSFGVQVIILVPTAELVSQICGVLSRLIKYHPNITYLSVVGGKAHTTKKEEWRKIDSANIVISTLGRLLEHQDKNYNLDLSNLKYLVIDETDYLLEKNFLDEMDSILNYLPKNRVTWLFSATQISSAEDLKRLSLKDPVFIGTDSNDIMIPKNLTQTFMKIDLPDKLQALWNLLEAQSNSNSIVFFSTQKQVLFVYRLFSALHPRYKLIQLRSNMRLDKRMDSVHSFSEHKKGCVLLATDVASRGLDFPSVSLVIQYDLPRELDDYIHRAGRTARFNANGVSVLMVMPSEMAFMKALKEKNVTLKQIRGNVLKTQKRSISEKASIKFSTDLELFKIAKNAFLAYLRDYAKIPPRFHTTQCSEDIFVINKLPINKFAKSLGFKTIPEEASELGFAFSAESSVSLKPNQPFFTVKKKLEDACKKRRLDVTSDDENTSDDNDEKMEVDGQSSVEMVQPAFIFELALKELQSSSKRDKEYFESVIKSKYGKKKAKLHKEQMSEEVAENENDED